MNVPARSLTAGICLRSEDAQSEHRCRCGQLLAVLLEEGVEIKCRRCKRFEKISLKELIEFFSKDKEPLSSDPAWMPAERSDLCQRHIKEGR